MSPVALRSHKTRIVCTIGPASSSPEVMRAMIRAGMDVARLNLSHGDLAGHGVLIAALRAAAASEDRPLAIMADLPGPKIRLGDLGPEPLRLTPGEHVRLTAAKAAEERTHLPVELEGFAEAVGPEDTIFLKDGLVQLRVVRVSGAEVEATVLVGGELRSQAGVNLPGVDLGLGAFTDRDRDCLAFALAQGVDAVAQSFVADGGDVRALRRAAAGLGARPFVVAKVERSLALRNIDEILEESDAIMVARGDLGVETSLERIALVQKHLISLAVRRGRPVITATQMLESMVANPRPTRAEATDVANAILDGTDCVMLSGESAVGAYPVEAVAVLAGIAEATEPERWAGRRTPAASSWRLSPASSGRLSDEVGPTAVAPVAPQTDPVDLITSSVCDTVERGFVAAVLVPTLSGATARNVARFRLPAWVVAVSPLEVTCRALQFSYGVCAVRETAHDMDWNAFARSWLASEGVTRGLVVLTAGPSAANPSGNHRMELIGL